MNRASYRDSDLPGVSNGCKVADMNTSRTAAFDANHGARFTPTERDLFHVGERVCVRGLATDEPTGIVRGTIVNYVGGEKINRPRYVSITTDDGRKHIVRAQSDVTRTA